MRAHVFLLRQCVFVCVLVRLFVWLSVCLCVCLSVGLPVCLFGCLYVCLFERMFVCLSASLSVCLFARCVSVRLTDDVSLCACLVGCVFAAGGTRRLCAN